MSEVAEVVPKILEVIFSEVPEPFKTFNINIKLLENSRSFWSECYQIIVTSNDEKYSDKVISPLFVKIPRISAVNAAVDPGNDEENAAILRSLTAREVIFYKDFKNIQFPGFPIPRFYYGESLENEPMAGLVCEDFSGIGSSIDFVPGFNQDQTLQLMESLGQFHAKTIQISGDIPWEKYPNDLYDQEYMKMLYNDTLDFENLCPEKLSGRIQAVKHAFDEDSVEKNDQLNIQLGMPFVICHNDLNTSNILWNKETGKIQAFIDFQHISKGAVTFDILRIISLGLTSKDRKENTEKYLHHYYETFKKNFNANSIPFSFEQLQKSYSAHFNFVNATSLFSLYYYYKMYKDTTLDQDEDPAEKEEKAEEILNRAIGILDDIIQFSRKN
uniref:CHK domain-containing protein n=1 Tax=Caenorhabditis tropicalis TaxID=1561998 RepID=A0A1I7TIT6_9PELO